MEMRLPEQGDALTGVELFAGLEPEVRRRVIATAVGGPAFGTHCLIKYIGRKSGKIFITGLCYGVVGGEVVIVASKGGADNHPAWYLNIREQDTIDFQVATQAFRATLREPEGAERERLVERGRG